MNEHERTLALAAAAIDFPLSHEEAANLTRHLAGCPACAAKVSRMREDAANLAAVERMPAPAHVRQAVIRAASGDRSHLSRGAGLRWSFVAAVLALLAVGGTFVAGAVLERLRDQRPAPTDPATVVRTTPQPVPTHDQAPRPTPGPTGAAAGWHDLGLIGRQFDGHTIATVLPGPDGGLVAVGRDQGSTRPMVWVSDDGSSWSVTDQPEDVFGGRVPSSGALRGGTLWVVGWDIAVTGAQRAMWSSDDGSTWARAGGDEGLLGTEANDLRLTAGPAGLLVWAPDGRVWTSSDGLAWTRSDLGIEGLTDAAVAESIFSVVGREGERAFVASSGDGETWSEPTTTRSATADAQVGIERDQTGLLLSWVGEQAFAVTREGWQERPDASPIPAAADVADIVGGAQGFAAVATPTGQGVQRAAVGDGSAAWRDERSDATPDGARTLVAVAPLGDGWFVLTRQGSTYRGWRLYR